MYCRWGVKVNNNKCRVRIIQNWEGDITDRQIYLAYFDLHHWRTGASTWILVNILDVIHVEDHSGYFSYYV